MVGQALLASLPSIIVAVAVIVGLYLNAKWSKSTSTGDAKKKSILGYTILAVKAAEKILPDDSDSKAVWMQKADAALKHFIAVYTQYEGQEPSAAVKAEFIQLKEQILLELDKVKLAKEAAKTEIVKPT